MTGDVRLSNEGQGAQAAANPAATPGPGAVRVALGTIELNADRTEDERLSLVIVNTGDRPVQIGSHLHLPDANTALAFDREAAQGFRLDIPSGTSQRFEPGASREVHLVALKGNRRVPGIQLKPAPTGEVDHG
ncbi:urease subunit beta [Kribbella antiqua]|uniref:Urease subunit beta n=1 Tax=Kribbella antiqua TaxID=2512217 RepID=A0A4R2IKS2_9ACTN|nr:urease subunit beta [Kribbella antiqua]TCO45574.1 urease subunit beta [Kribbella antiqua]